MTIFQTVANEEFFEIFTSKYDKKFICRFEYVQAKKYGVSTSEGYGYLSRIGYCSIWDLWYEKSIDFKVNCLQNVETHDDVSFN